jgi:hypothetical protein
MKPGKALLIVFLLVSVSLLKPQTTARPRHNARPSTQQIGKEVEDLERQLRIAYLKGDAGWLEEHLSEAYTEIDGEGKLVTRAQLIQAFKTSDVAYDTMNLSEGSAKIFNADTVLLTQKEDLAGGLHGENFSGKYRCTRVWVKENGFWQLASSQLTPIAG